ncbi:MAG: chloride channel protein [Bacteroidetes bacterium]|nr:MAG: chloride channel protein [Bacteroidota bacterium]
MARHTLLDTIYLYQYKILKPRQFVLVLSFVVGVLSGLAGVVLKNTLYYTNFFLTNGFTFRATYFLYLLYPLFGLVLTYFFIKYIVKDNISHGISKILFRISKQQSQIKPHNTWTSLVACTLTLGFGGSVGPEAPGVLTGSAIGSNLARLFRQDYKNTTLLLGCGAAGALASLFSAPIAGVVFVIEVLLMDMTMTNLIPLLISAVTGSLVSTLLMGKDVVFSFVLLSPFHFHETGYYILLGIFTGLVSVYFMRGSAWIERMLAKIPVGARLPLSGVVLAALIFVYPSLFGEGYTILKDVLKGHAEVIGNPGFFGWMKTSPYLFLLIIFGLIISKVVAMSFTQGSGGIGGTFAPALFVGVISGLFLSRGINLSLASHLPESNFALVGMAGIMTGVMHAPLTAIFLIAEITGGYELLTPLIISSTVSYLTVYYFEPHSIYARQLATRKELITHHKDNAILTFMDPSRLIEKNFISISPDKNLGDLVKIVAESSRNIFPVVDAENTFYGVVTLDHIRGIMFDRELYDTKIVRDLMYMPEFYITPDDDMEKIMTLFQRNDRFNIPVLSEGKYIGFISRATVFSEYRKLLKQFSEE